LENEVCVAVTGHQGVGEWNETPGEEAWSC